MDTITINERLKELRVENGLTQKQLGDKIGLGQTTVASHEKSHTPTLECLIAYADFFECSLDYLAGREEGDLPYALSAQERELIQSFRSLKPSVRTFAFEQLKLLSESVINR